MRFPLDLNVYFQNNDYVKKLQAEIVAADGRAEEWKQKYKALQEHYCDVQRVNIEMSDILRYHGIKFREGLDERTWYKARK